MIYLDSSALVKLVVQERETVPLRAVVFRRTLVSSSLAIVEVLRNVARHGDAPARAATRLLAGMTFIAVDRPLLERAARLEPPALRSLDAIHLASAMELGDELEAVVTYDTRMIEAARLLGIPTASPA